MSAGTMVRSPDGESIVLVDIGQTVVIDNDLVRVWTVELEPDQVQPWHLHHNPYVVLSLEASPGRMDWLDGSEPRFLDEYVGGAVYRPVSPVHRLTNIGDRRYSNRLVEFKDLGEKRPEPLDIGPGARSVQGERPGPVTEDGREPVLVHPHTSVWEVVVPSSSSIELDLAEVPHVLSALRPIALASGPDGGSVFHPGGATSLHNDTDHDARWFVVELTYLAEPRIDAGDPS